jgi:hypothetical protein
MTVKLFSRNEILASERNPQHSVDIRQGAVDGRDDDRKECKSEKECNQRYLNRRAGRADSSLLVKGIVS